ncbi:hypothetical protein P170DRAFT_440023 [Aspergillus steynii IBT 23096]|uniref:BTB domain-containing protein n=1 Tax=Aspergillus steynii IBT 23096 TaxID=1392250 RepID=A0A2I2FVX5_9EURO|nr:uncharacterized protein P170DRAFT_440023 [Aspergillus steynii IBT 23096]PLB44781.1 hypothetical protein P170DRAFT_440023 [Aspergillus steynii IBT 23096]
MREEVIDRKGDIVITVIPPAIPPLYILEPTTTNPRCFKVSSKTLTLGSKYFQTMLNPRWSEGNELRETGTLKLWLHDTGPDTFAILLNLLHSRFRHIGTLSTIDQLTTLAVQVDYFQCDTISAALSQRLIQCLDQSRTTVVTTADARWVLVAWMLADSKLFSKVTRAIQRQIQGEFDSLRLPIPPTVQAAINKGRSNAIADILSALSARLQRLQSGPILCGFMCHSFKLGAFIRQLTDAGIYPGDFAPGEDQYDGLSVDGVLDALGQIKDYTCVGRDERGRLTSLGGRCSGSWGSGLSELQSVHTGRPGGLVLKKYRTS